VGRQSSRPARPSNPRVGGEPTARSHRTRRLIVAVVCAIPAIMVWVLLRPAFTESGWVRTERADGEFRAGSVEQVTNMTCRDGLYNGAAVRFAWDPPVGGVAHKAYRWVVEGTLFEQPGQERTGFLPASAREIVFFVRDFGSTEAAIWDRTGSFSLYTLGPGDWESAAPRGGMINFRVYAPFWGLSMVNAYCLD